MKPFSLIIPTHRVTNEMLRTINNFFFATDADSEVLVVLDGSEDLGMLRSFDFLETRLRVFSFKEQRGPAFARNMGMKKSKNDLIIFCDSDVVVPLAAFDNLTRCKTGEVLLPSVHPISSKTRYAGFFSDQVLAPKKIGDYIFAASACFAIHKSDALTVNGFDENYRYAAGEDWDFFRRIQEGNVDVGFQNSIKVFHQNPQKLFRLLSRSFRYGSRGNFQKEDGQNQSRNGLGFVYSGVGRKIATIVLGLISYRLSTIAVKTDFYSKLSQKTNRLRSHLFEKLGTREIPIGTSPDFLTRLIFLLETLDMTDPWTNTLPIDAESESRYQGYRLIMLTWRATFVLGVILSPRLSTRSGESTPNQIY